MHFALVLGIRWDEPTKVWVVKARTPAGVVAEVPMPKDCFDKGGGYPMGQIWFQFMVLKGVPVPEEKPAGGGTAP
jgi:hypothetical protein